MILSNKVIEIEGFKVFEKIAIQNMDRVEKKLDNEACFMFLLEGSFEVRTPVNTFSISQENGFLSRCGDYFFDCPTDDQVIEMIGIYFHPEIIKKLVKDEPVKYNQSLKHQTPINDLLENYKKNLVYYIDNPEFFDEDLQLLKLKELLMILSKFNQAPSFQHFISALFSPQEYDFRQVIEHNQYASMSLDELAYLAHMSLATFKRKFKELYNESPAEYLKNKKLEKAAEHLSVDHLKISEIAYDCGFESVGTFNRLFKKKHGLTPTEFRMSQNDK